MSRITRRRLAASAAVSVVGLLAVTPVSAAPPHEFNGGYRQKLQLAGAIWSTQTETTATSLELQIFERTEQRQGETPVAEEPALILFYDHSEIDAEAGALVQTSYEGFTGDSLTFDFDPSLRSGATVRDSVHVHGFRCFYPLEEPEGEGSEPSCEGLPSDTLEIDLTWTQTGEIYRDVQRMGHVVPAQFVAHARDVTAASNAVVSGEVVGDHLQLVDGAADYGVLIRGNYQEHILVQ
jgi:hypothetical protein